MKTIQEIRDMSNDQILDAIEDNRQAMFHMRFQKASGELKDTNLVRRNRRELARLKTVLAERSAAATADSSKGKNNA